MIFFGQASLQHAIRLFMARYHTERNHQGLGNHYLQPVSSTPYSITAFNGTSASAGLRNYYHRTAA